MQSPITNQNNQSTDSVVLSEKPKPNLLELICQKIVVSSLVKMKNGLLILTMPDGSKISNETAEADIVAEIIINDYNFFVRCVKFGAIGFAESYIDDEWNTENIADVIRWFILNAESSTVMEGSARRCASLDMLKVFNWFAHILRSNTKAMSRKNISAHYDLSNQLFNLFLDPSMTYSSGLFLSRQDCLEKAQLNKYEKLCQSLMLDEYDHVLEIGCGWGGFAVYAAKNYGCRVTGVTISQEQFDYATKRIVEEGLQDRIKIELKDYRDIEGKFDKIASIEMVEALGDEHVDSYFSKCNNLLTKNGLLAIQMITSPDSRYDLLRTSVDFIQKHIFPGSLLLSIERVVRATRKTSDLHLVELHDFAESYAKTLNLWSKNFEANLERVKALGFDEAFIRKWFYYFSYCEAAFDMRQISVVQITMSRPNNQFIRDSRKLD